MVAEYRPLPDAPASEPASPPARRRTRSKAAQAVAYTPDACALAAAIQALWGRERRLGGYVPAEELCLDLDELSIEALRALRARVRLRLDAHLAAQPAAQPV